MKLEDQVPSIELCKRLEELGVKQESLYHWCRFWSTDLKKDIWVIREIPGGIHIQASFSAFTVAELGELLPKDFWVWKNNIEIRPNSDGYFLPKSDRIVFGLASEIEIRDKSEANARARMLIYLLENKLIELK